MNCKQVEELLPLYISRDLEKESEKLVTRHVQSCGECTRSAEEYREAQQLLQYFEPPPFSEGVYSGIRQRVLREIDRESSSPTVRDLVASLFRPRVRWAVATALVLAFSLVAFYFIANRNETRQGAVIPRAIDKLTGDQQSGPLSGGSEIAAAPTAGEKPHKDSTMAPPRQANPPHQPEGQKRRATDANRRFVPVNTAATPSITIAASPKSGDLVDPNAAPIHDQVNPEKTLRVEMQTKDRNIRIIWFSPQRTKQGSPSKSSKDTQEVRSYV